MAGGRAGTALAGVAVLLALTALGAASAPPASFGDGPALGAGPVVPAAGDAAGDPALDRVEAERVAELPLDVLAVVLAVLLLALLARAVLRARHQDAPSAPPPPAPPPGEGLVPAVRRAVEELDAARPGAEADAVVACWLRLEAAAASLGEARRPAQTPTEFTEGLLAAHDLDPAAVADLRRCYQRARFGRAGAGVGPADVAAASAALRRSLDRLPARAAAPRASR